SIPLVWVSRWRAVTTRRAEASPHVSSGRASISGASRSSRPSSASISSSVAVKTFVTLPSWKTGSDVAATPVARFSVPAANVCTSPSLSTPSASAGVDSGDARASRRDCQASRSIGIGGLLSGFGDAQQASQRRGQQAGDIGGQVDDVLDGEAAGQARDDDGELVGGQRGGDADGAAPLVEQRGERVKALPLRGHHPITERGVGGRVGDELDFGGEPFARGGRFGGELAGEGVDVLGRCRGAGNVGRP